MQVQLCLLAQIEAGLGSINQSMSCVPAATACWMCCQHVGLAFVHTSHPPAFPVLACLCMYCPNFFAGVFCVVHASGNGGSAIHALLLQEFVPVARELEKNWTRFTPHYIVWVCPRVYRNSDECQSQCIHKGRYCTPDPDGELHDGYSGKDVVQVHATTSHS